MDINTIKEFNYKGFDCIVRRVGFTHKDLGVREAINITGSDDFSMRTWWLCGYVILPADHPLNGEHYDDLNDVIDVHQGLTFSDNGENNTLVIGFDCNHFGDGDKENTEEFVISEIQKVVDQLLDPEKDLRGLLDDMAYGEG